MPDGKPRATLGDRQARGGVIGGKGYGFQAAYIVSRIPLWLADPDFVQFLQEGAGDVDVHFDRESGEERCYVQVKNYSVKPATAREVLAQFRETDEGSPGTYTLFTLACPGLHDRLKQLRGAVEELRGATPFFRPGEDPILDNTWADLERLVEKLNLPVDAGFLVDKVHFDTDLAGLRDDASLRRLFAGSLMELERWAAVPPEAVARAYEKLALKCHRALRETYAREQVEAVIQEAVEEVVPPRVISDVCPYRSLNAFTEADAEFFFGRQGAVSRLVESLRRESRFLAVLGPSGSGKSSLVQAGLIPELRTGAVPGSDRWGVIVTRPADHPFHGLEAQGLAGAGEELVGAVQTWLEGHPEQTRLVLVVDQFEELLVTSPRELRGAFVAQLVELLGADLAVTVLLVMRNDFYSRLDREAPALLAWLERGLVNVPLTLSRDDLRDIVEKPAQAVGLAFEPGLVDAILDDAMESAPAAEGRTGRSTVLPLLEFALSQLWERRRDGVLTHDAFKAIGGVTGGLMQWADRAFYRLKKEEHKQLARRVLTDLVHLGDESQGLPDSRRRRSLEDLCRSEEERETVRWVVRQLQLPDARLLATGRDLQSGQETVELIHDTLLREWGLLERWLKEDRIFLAWCQEIEGQVHAWVESAPDLPKRRDSERLLRGRALAVAERWLVERGEDLQDRVRSFIRASAARARRIRRLAVGGAGLALLIVSALAILFWGQRNAALDAQEVALARQLAAQSPQTLDRYPAQPSRSVLLAIESLRRYPESAANQALTDGLESLPREVARMTHDGEVYAVAFSPDGKRAVSGSRDGTARVWEAATGREVARMTHDGEVYVVAFSPDGRWVVSGGNDGTVQVWEAATGREVARMTHASVVQAVAFSPDGKWVVSGSWDTTARVWEAATGREVARMTHDGEVRAVAFSPGGEWVVSGGNDGTARVWEAATGREVARMTHDSLVSAVAFSPDGHWVVSGSSDDTARVWEAATGREVVRATHNDWVRAVAFSSDGHWVVSGSSDDTARVWEAATGREIARMTHDGEVYAVAFSPDGQWVVSAGEGYAEGGWLSEGTARVWEAATGDEVARMTHDGEVHSVAFSPDGQWVVSGDHDTTARVWEAATGREVARMTHDDWVSAVAFNPDGRWVVSSSGDRTARVWEAATGREVARMAHDGEVSAVAFGPDGHRVVSGDYDGTALVWEAATGDEVARMTHDDWVYAVAFSPDGKRVVSGGMDGTARVWEAATGDKVARMTHDDWVSAVSFSPDGQWVVSGSGDGTARVWEAATGSEVVRMTHGDVVWAVAFSPDGHRVVSGSGDYTARMWLWRPEDLIEMACDRLTRNLTPEEWQQYLGDEPYRPTCPDLPVPEPDTPLQETTAVLPGYFWSIAIALACIVVGLAAFGPRALRARAKARRGDLN